MKCKESLSGLLSKIVKVNQKDQNTMNELPLRRMRTGFLNRYQYERFLARMPELNEILNGLETEQQVRLIVANEDKTMPLTDENVAFIIRKCGVDDGCSAGKIKKVRTKLKISNPGGRRKHAKHI